MATRIIFSDLVCQYPNRYNLDDLGDGLYQIMPNAGTVSTPGTPLSATNLNAIADEVIFKIKDTSTSTTAYTGDIANLSTYYEGLTVMFKPSKTNTGASTININNVGAVPIKKTDNSGNIVKLEANDLIKNKYSTMTYDGTQFLMNNPSADLAETIADIGAIEGRLDTDEISIANLKTETVKLVILGGTANTYSADVQSIDDYTTGLNVDIIPNVANTGASTLNLNEKGAKALKYNGSDITSGFLQPNKIYRTVYNGVSFEIQPSSSFTPANNGNVQTNLNADMLDGKHVADLATAAQGTKADNALPASEVVTTPTASKVLRLNASKKLPADITGDAGTLGGNAPSYFASASSLNNLAGSGRTTETVKGNADNISNIILATSEVCPYGIEYTISTGAVTRLGGMEADFNKIMPWAGMKRCIVDDDVNVLYYLDPDDSNKKEDGTVSKLDGTDGQVMVEIPAHYYKTVSTNNPDKIRIYVSMIPLEGFKIDPYFLNNDGTIAPKKYFSAFEGSIYDISAGAYLLADEQVADFTASTGDKLCSIAGTKPCSGTTQNLTIGNSRILANNRGSKWQQEYFTATSCIQRLMAIEYGSLDIQSKLSQGVTNITDDSSTNMAVNTGATVSLGNHSGEVSIAHPTTGQTTHPFNYRGIENFYGNIWKWVDGINIKNLGVYLCTSGAFASDKFDTNYVNTGIVLPNTTNYVQSLAYSEKYDFAFLPATVGSSARFDYFWQGGNGNFVARLGGGWADGSKAGAFHWNVNAGSAYRTRYVGARLCAK